MEKIIYEGNISVKAVLESNYRKVIALYVDQKKKDRDTNYIINKAKLQQVPIHYCQREDIDAKALGHSHGGLIAEVSSRSYQQPLDLKDCNFIAIIEGIEDPFNYGFVLRSLYASGVQAIITTSRNWSNAESVVAKSSAGASEALMMVVNDDLGAAIDALNHQFKIVCAARNEHAIPMYDCDMRTKVCIALGGEKRGLSKAVASRSDQDVYIPYGQNYRNALSAASAAAVLAFEVNRQRYQFDD